MKVRAQVGRLHTRSAWDVDLTVFNSYGDEVTGWYRNREGHETYFDGFATRSGAIAKAVDEACRAYRELGAGRAEVWDGDQLCWYVDSLETGGEQVFTAAFDAAIVGEGATKGSHAPAVPAV